MCSRQLLSHSTIRAGRNSPDKELRYHRTVIVTAAVHRSFRKRLNSYEHHHPLLTYRHWAGVSPYTLPFGFAGTCVLDKQSLSNLLLNPNFTWGRASPIGYAQLLLPSSLNICLTVALVYSTNPPVSVMRYGKI